MPRSAEDSQPRKGGRPRVLHQPAKITAYVSVETMAHINATRNGTPLAEWVREAIEQRLQRRADEMQYTVYAIYPSDVCGGDYTEQDIETVNESIEEAIEATGLSNRARVIVTEDAGRYTLGIPQWDEELRAAVDAGIERGFAILAGR